MQLPWQPRSLEFMIWDASSFQCLSEIDVPEHNSSFGATRGDEVAEPFLDSSAVSRQRPHPSAGVLLLLDQPRAKSLPGWSSPADPRLQQLQPVLLPSPRASTRQWHLPLPRELQQRRHNMPHVPAGAKGVTGWNPELQHIVTPQGVFFQASYVLFVCPNIGHLYCSKATNDFDVFPLIHMHFVFWKAVKYFLIIFLILEKPCKWQDSGGKLPPLIT